MPQAMVATNTISAIAASVSMCAVGGSIPGMSDDQFETSVNRKIEPISARNGAGSVCIVSRIWLSTVADEEFEQAPGPWRE